MSAACNIWSAVCWIYNGPLFIPEMPAGFTRVVALLNKQMNFCDQSLHIEGYSLSIFHIFQDLGCFGTYNSVFTSIIVVRCMKSSDTYVCNFNVLGH
jgi:hypothetical protein